MRDYIIVLVDRLESGEYASKQSWCWWWCRYVRIAKTVFIIDYLSRPSKPTIQYIPPDRNTYRSVTSAEFTARIKPCRVAAILSQIYIFPKRNESHIANILDISKISHHCVHHPLHHRARQIPSLYPHYWLSWFIWSCYLFFS